MEIDGLNSKMDMAEIRLKQTCQKEKDTIAYIKWYNKTKKVLSGTYGIGIDETKEFAKILHDLKHHGSNVPKITRIQQRTVAQSEVKGTTKKISVNFISR
jgi:hypothetical protein